MNFWKDTEGDKRALNCLESHAARLPEITGKRFLGSSTVDGVELSLFALTNGNHSLVWRDVESNNVIYTSVLLGLSHDAAMGQFWEREKRMHSSAGVTIPV